MQPIHDLPPVSKDSEDKRNSCQSSQWQASHFESLNRSRSTNTLEAPVRSILGGNSNGSRFWDQSPNCLKTVIRSYRGPILTIHYRRERLQWARNHYRWRAIDWRCVIFLDESRFCLNRADGRIRIYRQTGERYNSNCVLEHDRFGGRSVMVWGAINENFRSDLIIV